MDKWTVSIYGLETLIAKLNAIVKEEVIKLSLNQGGKEIARWIKENRLHGPRPQYLDWKSGQLYRTLFSTKAEKQGNKYFVIISAPAKNKGFSYPRLHEFGGKFVKARPFMRPGICEPSNRQMVLDILTENINQAINEAK
jgi:hypothetical protein